MTWINTVDGGTFDFNDAAPIVKVEHVAASLSKLCRFNGHCREFYSVAQHAVLVSYLVQPQLAFEALHHDSFEAYVGDMTSPLKRFLGPVIEAKLWLVESAVRRQLNLKPKVTPSVKQADLVAISTERHWLMEPSQKDWGVKLPKPLGLKDLPPGFCVFNLATAQHEVCCWGTRTAEQEFLNRHYVLLHAAEKAAAKRRRTA